jgi:putative ABC transport system substrate-binding protein
MSNKIILTMLATAMLAFVNLSQAQQTKKVPRIGYVAGASRSNISARIEAFQRGMRELGYVEDKHIVIEWRFGEGKQDRLPAFVAELVRLKVDIIVTGGPISTRRAKEATVSIPIVMAQDTDPVGSGFAVSLARPGGNITGLSTISPEISGKRRELLKEVVPSLSRVAVFGSSAEPANAQLLQETELAARALRVQLQYLDILGPKDFETAFQTASKGRAEALLVLNSSVTASHRTEIVDLAVKSRLPAIYYSEEWVEVGGLTYGVSINDLYRRAATYVDKILKGAKPADLPVEQPIKFEFIINLKAAKQIGLTIPPNVLVRADKVTKEGQQASVVSTRGDQRLLDDVPVACSFSMTQRRINVASRTRLLLATRLTSLASSGRNRTVTAVVGLRVNTGVVTSSSWSSKSVRSWRSQNRASSSIESVEGILRAFIAFSIA